MQIYHKDMQIIEDNFALLTLPYRRNKLYFHLKVSMVSWESYQGLLWGNWSSSLSRLYFSPSFVSLLQVGWYHYLKILTAKAILFSSTATLSICVRVVLRCCMLKCVLTSRVRYHSGNKRKQFVLCKANKRLHLQMSLFRTFTDRLLT